MVDPLIELSYFRGGQRFAEGLADSLLDRLKLIVDAADERIVLQFRRDLTDFGADKTEQLGLAQDLAETLVVVLCDHTAHHLRSANPSAEADENHEILVAMRLHGSLHLVLRGFQFFLKRAPFIIVGKLGDACPRARMFSLTPRALANLTTSPPMFLTCCASCASTAMNPSAISPPRLSAIWARVR